jgi:HK97 family phage portal protein
MDLRRLFRWPRASNVSGGGVHFPTVMPRGSRIDATSIRGNPSIALGVTPVLRAVQLISNDLSRIPKTVQQREGQGWRAESEVSDLGAMLNNRPNDFQTATDWWQWMVTNVLVYGNSFSLISKRGNRVDQFIPLKPYDVQLQSDAEGNWYYTTAEYGTVDCNDVIHFRAPSYTRMGWGDSPIAIGAEAVVLAMLMEQAGVDQYRMPGLAKVAISTEEAVGSDNVRAMQDAFVSTHANREGLLKPVVVQNGSKVDTIGNTLVDNDWIAGRKSSIEDIGRIFGLPPFVLFAETGSTFSEAQARIYGDCLASWSNRFADELTYKLLDDVDERVAFDMTRLVRGTFSESMSAYQTAVQTSIMTPNEVRIELGLGSAEGLDDFFAGPNMQQPSNDQKGGAEDEEEDGMQTYDPDADAD